MGLRVLIVEDEILIAMDLEAQTLAMGHEVTGVARTVESCKAAALKNPPDVVLMDIRLADGTSGIDASKWLYDEMGVRCIFLSANLDESTRAMLSLTVDPIAFIGKPILPHKLEGVFAKL